MLREAARQETKDHNPIMAFALLNRLRRRPDPRDVLRPLYLALIAAARQPHWYLAGKVPDTNDGRFSMLSLLMSLGLLRLEKLGDGANAQAALLTELFVEDMEGQIREMGIGDVVIGKHVGKMMSALGGQLGAYRAALMPGGDLAAALGRNLYAGTEPDPAALAHSATEVKALTTRLDTATLAALMAGDVA
jgi:cytochrome b pre-mRNA-processing protein 3